MKNYIFISTVFIIIFIGCKKENDLNKSIFIRDSEYTDLPAYSEWGYNTFGAYYDRELFISNNIIVPAKIVASKNSMSFILNGQLGETKFYYSFTKEMSITFNLSGFSPKKYSDLTVLNDTTIDLKDSLIKVKISIDSLKYQVDVLSGELRFKRAQNLLVDKKHVEVILSGYFEFKALINTNPVTISVGRFDVGISPDNFYTY